MRRILILLSLFIFSCINVLAQERIYLDYQASTPVDPLVIKEMQPYLNTEFGNPHSSSHAYGIKAAKAITNARQKIANLINAEDPNTVVFTSGATEANNIAILGATRALRGKKNKIITCITENKAVIETAKSLEKEGFEVIFLKVNKDGFISLKDLEQKLDHNTALVSIMAVNNEIGIIQPIAKIGELSHKYGALFHTDATQAIGKIPLDVQLDNIDLLSLSGHKIYGPKGIGALYIRSGINIEPIMYGGGQEQGIRPGTVPVPLAVGLGKAAELAKENLISENKRITELRNYFLQELKKNNIKYLLHGSMQARIAGNINISFENIDGEEIIAKLPNVAISLGSACSSSNTKLSYVICALHTIVKPWGSPVRISIGRFTNEKEVRKVADELIKIINVIPGKNINHVESEYRLIKKYELAYVFLGRCPYCHIFAPTVKAFATKNNFPITAISIDGGKLAEFPSAIYDIEFAKHYDLRAFPVLLARTNKIEPFRIVSIGALPDELAILKALWHTENNN